MPPVRNLFGELPAVVNEESFALIHEGEGVRIERIVSLGHTSPPGFWYDQDRHEWVMVLKGAAKLRFEGEQRAVELTAGDCIDIPAHKRHRVEWTKPDEPTIWLAVFYGTDPRG